MSEKSNEIEGLHFLSGKIFCSPAAAKLALDCGQTKLYELINSGEIESCLDGSRRKIFVPSVVEYSKRKIAAARAERDAA